MPVPAEGERDGAERAAHGGVGLGRALRPAARLLHRRGGLGGAEPAAQRPLLRLPHGPAGPRHRAVSAGPDRGASAGPERGLCPRARTAWLPWGREGGEHFCCQGYVVCDYMTHSKLKHREVFKVMVT